MKILDSIDKSYLVRVPALNAAVIGGPKGYLFADILRLLLFPPLISVQGFRLRQETSIFLDEQRLLHCSEFIDFMNNAEDPNGVLFSGPNGVGKSSICLITFLTCFVRGLPVVYIPRCDEWVKASKTEDEANSYFMRAFLKQNADIIVRDPELLPFFEEQLTTGVVDTKSYWMLSEAVKEG